ncbi:hypothetical protein QL093DRAFT_2428078 [Fusarium oxysporum]|nr:hypothetical protein QL093DRAFT_2428078 [Fusarium oxysporum]
MTDASLAVNADDGGAHEKVTTGPDDAGDGMARRSSHGSSVHEVDKAHEPEPLPLHEKLLDIAQTPQPTNAATLAEFKDLLLEKASEINALDKTGKTALHIAVEHGLTTEAQCIIRDGANIAIADNEGQQPLYLACVEGHTELVKKAEATVVGFFKGKGESGRIRRNRPIQEIVYDPGSTDVMGTAIRNLTEITRRGSLSFNSKLYAKENIKLTWVHLPSTNMIWMNDLLTNIMSHEGYRTREYYEVRSFFRDSWVEVPDKESRSRMMRPRSVTSPKENRVDPKPEESEISESSKDIETEDSNLDREGERGGAREKNEKDTKKVQATTADSQEEQQKVYADWKSNTRQPVKKSHGFVNASAIYMPYLAYSTHCRHWDNRLVPDNQELKDAHDLYEELQDKYEGKDKQQHGSPTLDEWYYQFARS